MRLTHLGTCAELTARELLRRRLVLALSLLVPVVFLVVAAATTSARPILIVLAASTQDLVTADERRQSLLFIAIAGAGLIGAFLGAELVQRHFAASRRLVLAGYRASELIVGRLFVLAVIVVATGAYTWALLAVGAAPRLRSGVWVGLMLGTLVYAAWGTLIGTIFRRELESIFAILILVNIDAGWLQNPLYYATAESRWLIEALPAHTPVQIALLSEFTGEPTGDLVVQSLGYSAVLLTAAIVIYARRMRIAR